MKKPLIAPLIASVIAAALLAPAAAAVVSAAGWDIGPIIRGKNYSVNMPLTPTSTRSGGWYFDFPVGATRDAGHVHYVTFRHGSMVGKTRIVARFRVDAQKGTRFIPQETQDGVATVSLYMQRYGDSWSAKGKYEYYRWYAPEATVIPIAPGTYEMNVRLDDPQWISIMGKASGDTPGRMAASLPDIDRVGLTFGGPSGRGHGVFATAPARFTLLSFQVL